MFLALATCCTCYDSLGFEDCRFTTHLLNLMKFDRSSLSDIGGMIDRPLSPLELSPPPPTAAAAPSPAPSTASSSSSRRPGPQWRATPVRRQSTNKDNGAAGTAIDGDTSDDEYEALMKSAGKKSSKSSGGEAGKRQRKTKVRTPIILPPPPKPTKHKV